MRTLEAIQQEYTLLCAQLGDFEIKKARALAELLDKVAKLDEEANKVKELQAELDKQKAEAEALAPVEVADPVPPETK